MSKEVARLKLVYLEVEDMGNEIVAEARVEVTNRFGTRLHTFSTMPIFYEHDYDQLSTMNQALKEVFEGMGDKFTASIEKLV